MLNQDQETRLDTLEEDVLSHPYFSENDPVLTNETAFLTQHEYRMIDPTEPAYGSTNLRDMISRPRQVQVTHNPNPSKSVTNIHNATTQQQPVHVAQNLNHSPAQFNSPDAVSPQLMPIRSPSTGRSNRFNRKSKNNDSEPLIFTCEYCKCVFSSVEMDRHRKMIHGEQIRQMEQECVLKAAEEEEVRRKRQEREEEERQRKEREDEERKKEEEHQKKLEDERKKLEQSQPKSLQIQLESSPEQEQPTQEKQSPMSQPENIGSRLSHPKPLSRPPLPRGQSQGQTPLNQIPHPQVVPLPTLIPPKQEVPRPVLLDKSKMRFEALRWEEGGRTKTLVGMQNRSRYCNLNSSLQVLHQNEMVRELFTISDASQQMPFLGPLSTIFTSLSQDCGPVDPVPFGDAFTTDYSPAKHMNDVQHFMSLLLSRTREAWKPSRRPGKPQHGVFREKAFSLRMPIQSGSLEKEIQKMAEEGQKLADNDCLSRNQIFSLPPVVLVDLLRWKTENGFLKKNNARFTFPTEIDLTSLISPISLHDTVLLHQKNLQAQKRNNEMGTKNKGQKSEKNRKMMELLQTTEERRKSTKVSTTCNMGRFDEKDEQERHLAEKRAGPYYSQQFVYSLKGVVVHSGTMSGGHYISFVRVGEEEKRWVRCDDETLTFVSEEEMMTSEGTTKDGRERSTTAMILMFEQKTPLSKSTTEDGLTVTRKDAPNASQEDSSELQEERLFSQSTSSRPQVSNSNSMSSTPKTSSETFRNSGKTKQSESNFLSKNLTSATARTYAGLAKQKESLKKDKMILNTTMLRQIAEDEKREKDRKKKEDERRREEQKRKEEEETKRKAKERKKEEERQRKEAERQQRKEDEQERHIREEEKRMEKERQQRKGEEEERKSEEDKRKKKKEEKKQREKEYFEGNEEWERREAEAWRELEWRKLHKDEKRDSDKRKREKDQEMRKPREETGHRGERRHHSERRYPTEPPKRASSANDRGHENYRSEREKPRSGWESAERTHRKRDTAQDDQSSSRGRRRDEDGQRGIDSEGRGRHQERMANSSALSHPNTIPIREIFSLSSSENMRMNTPHCWVSNVDGAVLHSRRLRSDYTLSFCLQMTSRSRVFYLCPPRILARLRIDCSDFGDESVSLDLPTFSLGGYLSIQFKHKEVHFTNLQGYSSHSQAEAPESSKRVHAFHSCSMLGQFLFTKEIVASNLTLPSSSASLQLPIHPSHDWMISESSISECRGATSGIVFADQNWADSFTCLNSTFLDSPSMLTTRNDDSSSTVTYEKGVFINTRNVMQDPACVTISGPSLVLKSCKAYSTDNFARPIGDNRGVGSGASIAIEGNTNGILVTSSIFDECLADGPSTVNAGGIYIQTPQPYHFQMTNTTVFWQYSTSIGGGVAFEGVKPHTTIRMQESWFVDNFARISSKQPMNGGSIAFGELKDPTGPRKGKLTSEMEDMLEMGLKRMKKLRTCCFEDNERAFTISTELAVGQMDPVEGTPLLKKKVGKLSNRTGQQNDEESSALNELHQMDYHRRILTIFLKRSDDEIEISSIPELDRTIFQEKGITHFTRKTTIYCMHNPSAQQDYCAKRFPIKTFLTTSRKTIRLTTNPSLNQLSSPFMNPIRHLCKESDSLYLLSDFCPFSLKTLPTIPLSLDLTKKYASEVLAFLECLHNNQMIHTSLEPSHILIARDGHVRVTSLRSSCSLQPTYYQSPPSKPSSQRLHSVTSYTAPECLKGTPLSYSVDSWGFGALLFYMLVGEAPFQSESPFHLSLQIQNKTVTIPQTLPPDAISLIQHTLVSSPEGRLSIAEIKSHPFFSDVDWDQIASFSPSNSAFPLTFQPSLSLTPDPRARITKRKSFSVHVQDHPSTKFMRHRRVHSTSDPKLATLIEESESVQFSPEQGPQTPPFLAVPDATQLYPISQSQPTTDATVPQLSSMLSGKSSIAIKELDIPSIDLGTESFSTESPDPINFPTNCEGVRTPFSLGHFSPSQVPQENSIFFDGFLQPVTPTQAMPVKQWFEVKVDEKSLDRLVPVESEVIDQTKLPPNMKESTLMDLGDNVQRMHNLTSPPVPRQDSLEVVKTPPLFFDWDLSFTLDDPETEAEETTESRDGVLEIDEITDSYQLHPETPESTHHQHLPYPTNKRVSVDSRLMSARQKPDLDIKRRKSTMDDIAPVIHSARSKTRTESRRMEEVIRHLVRTPDQTLFGQLDTILSSWESSPKQTEKDTHSPHSQHISSSRDDSTSNFGSTRSVHHDPLNPSAPNTPIILPLSKESPLTNSHTQLIEGRDNSVLSATKRNGMQANSPSSTRRLGLFMSDSPQLRSSPEPSFLSHLHVYEPFSVFSQHTNLSFLSTLIGSTARIVECSLVSILHCSQNKITRTLVPGHKRRPSKVWSRSRHSSPGMPLVPDGPSSGSSSPLNGSILSDIQLMVLTARCEIIFVDPNEWLRSVGVWWNSTMEVIDAPNKLALSGPTFDLTLGVNPQTPLFSGRGAHAEQKTKVLSRRVSADTWAKTIRSTVADVERDLSAVLMQSLFSNQLTAASSTI
ncbi:putative serine/threonine protein kinase [Blattamonas nauphoetae]|uniref:non-specific serine/threonine protein kinase n=1 Tax=Blattamonas nauphoetae TaxID=2049346 RepID=A0ABQ9WN84_9EUKA|nr:putative serine/threonine protein kinase [Blattamonas nauphoetae]